MSAAPSYLVAEDKPAIVLSFRLITGVEFEGGLSLEDARILAAELKHCTKRP